MPVARGAKVGHGIDKGVFVFPVFSWFLFLLLYLYTVMLFFMFVRNGGQDPYTVVGVDPCKNFTQWETYKPWRNICIKVRCPVLSDNRTLYAVFVAVICRR